jgi:hypothetical protein
LNLTEVQLAQKVERWQERLRPLGISHWRIDRIIIGDESPSLSRSANASAGVSQNYDSVTFFFNGDYVEEAEERELDETIVHEWLHVFMRDLDELQERVEPWMPDATYEGYRDAWSHEREGEVERLARLIVSLYHADSERELHMFFRTVRSSKESGTIHGHA